MVCQDQSMNLLVVQEETGSVDPRVSWMSIEKRIFIKNKKKIHISHPRCHTPDIVLCIYVTQIYKYKKAIFQCLQWKRLLNS